MYSLKVCGCFSWFKIGLLLTSLVKVLSLPLRLQAWSLTDPANYCWRAGLLTKFPFENPISLGLLGNDLFSSFSLFFGISCVRERERRGIITGSVLVASHRFDLYTGVIITSLYCFFVGLLRCLLNPGLDNIGCGINLLIL
jgi:hypothetical protein